MKDGGFDVVIGNPPYVLGRETFDQNIKDYLSFSYKSYGGKFDLYIYFTERVISLLRQGGRLGYIVPNTLLANENAAKLRKMLLDSMAIGLIKTFASKVFARVHVENVILVAEHTPPSSDHALTVDGVQKVDVRQSAFGLQPDFRFNIDSNASASCLAEKLRACSVPLGNLTDICIGIQLGGSTKSKTKDSYISETASNGSFKKVLDGREIARYSKHWEGRYVRYGDWLHRKRDEKYFLNSKIVIRQIGAVPIATIDEDHYYTLNTIYNIVNASEYSLEYFLAVINSRVGRWFWRSVNSDYKTIFPKIKKTQIAAIPICLPSGSVHKPYEGVISLARIMLSLFESARKAPTRS